MTRHRILRRPGFTAVACWALLLGSAQAAGPKKPPPDPALLAAAAPRPADDRLYQALGTRPGIERLIEDFHERLLRDERTRPFFEDADHANLKRRLVEQLCVVSGGPCTYEGKDMVAAHEGVDINKADFNALVEVLQQSMRAREIPFGVQNRLLARLAPMHREVINK